MNNQDIKRIAQEQSAIDLNCAREDFCNGGSVVVPSKLLDGAKKYYMKPIFCNFAYYGSGLVVAADEEIVPFIENYIKKYPDYRAFDAPQLNVLNSELKKHGQCICHIAEYFLPDVEKTVEINAEIATVLVEKEKLSLLYENKRFPMALLYDNKSKRCDVLAVAGYIDGELAGIAGASNDSATMWQIGIDVLPRFRNRAVACTLTKKLTDAIISRGIVPFYCTAWSNIASKANAVKCGYKTAWVEMTAKKVTTAMEMMGEKPLL